MLKGSKENHIISTVKVQIKLGCAGNTEYWTDKDWKNHRKYVEELKANGKFGEIVEFEISYVHNPLFDNLSPQGLVSESCKLVILDFSK